jgi:hypothetical protein
MFAVTSCFLQFSLNAIGGTGPRRRHAIINAL